MIKVVLVISVILNIIFGVFAYLSQSTIDFNNQEIERIQRIYNEDVGILELMLKDRISKTGTLDLFKKKLKSDNYFDKPSESGVGAGGMFFVFDNDGSLKKVEKHDFAEK